MHAHTSQVEHRVLHGLPHVTALAGAGALLQGGKQPNEQVHAGVHVAQRRAREQRRVIGPHVPAGVRGGSAHALGQGVKGLGRLIAVVGVRAAQRPHDEPRVQGVHAVPRQPQTLEGRRATVFHKEVGLGEKVAQDARAIGGGQIYRD